MDESTLSCTDHSSVQPHTGTDICLSFLLKLISSTSYWKFPQAHPHPLSVCLCTAVQQVIGKTAEGTVHWVGLSWLRCNTKFCQNPELIQKECFLRLSATADVTTLTQCAPTRGRRTERCSVVCHFYFTFI